MNKSDIKERIDAVPNVGIDEEGTFKYVQIRIKQGGYEKIIIRGFQSAEYHIEVYEDCRPQLEVLGFNVDCIGGGRIKHDPFAKKLSVYGYSMQFGRADHAITVTKLKEFYPDYSITWSNEGY